MPARLTNFEKIHRLPWLIAAGALNSAFTILTIFGSVFVLFLSELGLDKTRIGFILSLLPFCGVLALLAQSFIARIGYKRAFLIFFSSRKTVVLLFLLTPYLLGRFGLRYAFFWVTGSMLLFGICRAVGETALYSWVQEAVPDYIRGRFSAIESTICTISGMLATLIGAYVVGVFHGLGKFMILLAVGAGVGYASVICFSFVPGGAPSRSGSEGSRIQGSIFKALADKNFLFFCGGFGLVSFAYTAVMSFIPLFMKEQLGFTDSNVILLGIGTYGGMLMSAYIWGWAADRYGSKPVMSSGLCLMLLIPVFFFLLPRGISFGPRLAMIIFAFAGLATIGWSIGYSRYLFVSAVPAEYKSPYMSFFYAWQGLAVGCGPLVAGWLIDAGHSIHWAGPGFVVDSYTPIFGGGLLLMLGGLFLVSRVRSDGAVPLGKFAGMFIQGNPLMAFGSLIRYRFIGDEDSRVWITERMGRARNPLTVVEMLEALQDPSFNVRHAAIIAASRMPPEPRLVHALIEVLVGSEPDLSISAAWALGNMRAKAAILPLREIMWSNYPALLQARSARALGLLGDTGIVPFLLNGLKSETDEGTRIAFASALGLLRSGQATELLLPMLRQTSGPTQRGELALALASILGFEPNYIRLLRRLRNDPSTASAQAVLALQKDLGRLLGRDRQLSDLVKRCARSFGSDDYPTAAKLLSKIIRTVLTRSIEPLCAQVLSECADRLDEFGPQHREYILLSLHAIYVALEQGHKR